VNENEVIIVDGIPGGEYDKLIEESVKYAIISLPFTVDRMKIPNEKQRTLNIAKGKVAEALFEYFCQKNDISLDTEPCTTPFWTVDNRDFLLNNSEWDIKNNFLYHSGNVLANHQYTDLPALVPNRFTGDQWSKRNTKMIGTSSNIEFLFTWLKGASLSNGKRGPYFLEIILTDDQHDCLRKLYKKYQGQPQTNEPYSADRFWNHMDSLGSNTYFKLNFRPELIITAYANDNQWNLFKNTGPYDRDHNFGSYLNPQWYTKSQSGSLNFMNGTFWTRITNATAPTSTLPSFLSLFPHLSNSINCGYIKP
jgi:hypothetical protein